MRRLLSLLHLVSFASTYLAGILGVVIVVYLGAPLAMLVQMYGGNTEPRTPSLPFPIVALVLGLALPLWPALRRRWALATVASIPLVLLPFWQVARLARLAGAP